jgi:hypothetical protein
MDFQSELKALEKQFRTTGPGTSAVGLEAGAKLMAEYSEKVAASQVRRQSLAEHVEPACCSLMVVQDRRACMRDSGADSEKSPQMLSRQPIAQRISEACIAGTCSNTPQTCCPSRTNPTPQLTHDLLRHHRVALN